MFFYNMGLLSSSTAVLTQIEQNVIFIHTQLVSASWYRYSTPVSEPTPNTGIGASQGIISGFWSLSASVGAAGIWRNLALRTRVFLMRGLWQLPRHQSWRQNKNEGTSLGVAGFSGDPEKSRLREYRKVNDVVKSRAKGSNKNVCFNDPYFLSFCLCYYILSSFL